jgi:hypothetical protein
MFKKINFKSILIGIIIGIVLSSSVFAGEEIMQYIFTQSNCKLIVDGQEYNNPDIPITLFMKDNSNFAPLAVVRDLCNKLDVPFVYDNVTKEIRITTTSVTTTGTNNTDNTNIIGKEENVLSEVVGSTENYSTYEENGLIIVESNNEKYVEVFSIMQKLQNTNYKLVYDGVNVYSLMKSNEIIADKINSYSQINTKNTDKNSKYYIKYNDYIEKIESFIE